MRSRRSRASAPTVPGLGIVVRLSAFDMVPYREARRIGVGEPEAVRDAQYGIRRSAVVDSDDEDLDAALDDARARARACSRGSASGGSASPAGSPYYNPHMQRPAMFPPLDGYEPPEDPLRGVARQIAGDRDA